MPVWLSLLLPCVAVAAALLLLAHGCFKAAACLLHPTPPCAAASTAPCTIMATPVVQSSLNPAGITEPVRLDANDNGVRIGLGRQEVRRAAGCWGGGCPCVVWGACSFGRTLVCAAVLAHTSPPAMLPTPALFTQWLCTAPAGWPQVERQYTAAEFIERRALEVELQADEDEERKRKREVSRLVPPPCQQGWKVPVGRSLHFV